MDGAAIALARDNDLPVIVFSIEEPGNLLKVLRGEGAATVIASAEAVGPAARQLGDQSLTGTSAAAGTQAPTRSAEGDTTMAAGKFDLKDLEKRMRGALDALKREFAGLRTGRASAHLLDPVVVNVYGAQDAASTRWRPSRRPTRARSRCRSGTRATCRPSTRRSARPTSGSTRSSTARSPPADPVLTAERRPELVKLAHKYAEHAPRRRAQRAPRRHGPSQEAREGRQDEPGRPSQESRPRCRS